MRAPSIAALNITMSPASVLFKHAHLCPLSVYNVRGVALRRNFSLVRVFYMCGKFFVS